MEPKSNKLFVRTRASSLVLLGMALVPVVWVAPAANAVAATGANVSNPLTLTLDPNNSYTTNPGDQVELLASISEYKQKLHVTVEWGDGSYSHAVYDPKTNGWLEGDLHFDPATRGSLEVKLSANHVYHSPGTYHGRVSVSLEGKGQSSAGAAFSTSVSDVGAPTPVVIEPNTSPTTKPGERWTLAALLDYGEPMEKQFVNVDWGDGTEVSTATWDPANPGSNPPWVSFEQTYDETGEQAGSYTSAWMNGSHIFTTSGTYEVKVTVKNPGGWVGSASISVAVVGRGEQTVTITSVPETTYGDIVTVEATGGHSGNPVTFSAGPADVCTILGDSRLLRAHGAGTCTLTAKQAGNDHFLDATPAVRSFTIHRAKLVITPDDKSRGYSDPEPTYTATYQGLKAGDTAASIPGITVSGPASDSPPGRYPIKVSGASPRNYIIDKMEGTLTVDPEISLSQTGLPKSMAAKATIDSREVALPVTKRVGLDTRHSYAFPSVVITGELIYVTAKAPQVRLVFDNIVAQATYDTIPGLIRNSTSDSEVISSLSAMWADIENEIADNGKAAATRDVKRFARYLIDGEDDWGMSRTSLNKILTRVQLVYEYTGGTGRL